ncbi:hypothetical protein [Brevibacterium otitidis]|uniref:Phage terminase-like protein, large subunit, contains N-terminal HTH domain n=1 Tax=Brevibacterium otitidis TaxID=53364 RepID=A0ABV5X0Z9_9MICO|nr:terminase [Brevibacterium otitidis]
MPWKPQHEGDFPTLGWSVIDWITENLAAPDRLEYEPLIPYAEQEDFILRFYEIDPATGRRKIRRGVLSRPRGWGKSPIVGAIMAAEALGNVVFDGWDANGQPVGKPWASIVTPLVQVAAVSEDQTRNTWSALLEMLEGPVVDNYPGLEPMSSFVNLPRGWMRFITSSGTSVKGARTVFSALDQTESWFSSNGGHKLHETMDSNAAKMGGSYIETPNAFVPGTDSVAERTASYWAQIQEGTAKATGLYYDHREAPADTDLADRESLTLGLRIAYGDAAKHPDGCLIHEPPCPPGHADLESRIQSMWDPTKDVQVSRADWLNQITHASDSWLSKPEVIAAVDMMKTVDATEPIVLGFDGSRGRVKGHADATAIIGCRVSDGHLFEIGIWEQPKNFTPTKDEPFWQVPVDEVELVLHNTFRDYRVVGLYADPSGWASNVAAWEAKYGHRLRVKSKRDAPMTMWPRGKGIQIAEYVKKFHDAVVNRECSIDGSSVFVRHLLNARRRHKTSGVLLYKSFPESPDKIDAAYAAVMAWTARLDAVAKGVGRKRNPTSKRITVVRR